MRNNRSASQFILYPALYTLLSFATPSDCQAQVRILFDATKAEMAGNADWVIDADQTNIRFHPNAYLTSSGNQSNPQSVPTPAQSGITPGTPETYWTGALSSWGIDCVNRGYTVETLPWNGAITYGNTANAQDLSHYNVYIVDEPNIRFTAAEMTAMMQFVQNGGGLFMISDHNISDRNNDGWDSPHIWDDFIANNSVQPYPFGIYFDTVDFSQTTTNISAASTDSIIHGPMGNVAKAQWSNGTTMTLNPAANSTVKGVVFKTGTTPGNNNAMVAYARYGSGKVAAIGDSSPTDDGTGNPACTLYNGYWNDASGNHRLLLMNITIWLATTGASPSSGIVQHNEVARKFSVFPNPSSGTVNLSANDDLDNGEINIYKADGVQIAKRSFDHWNKGELYSFDLSKGFYVVKVTATSGAQVASVIVE